MREMVKPAISLLVICFMVALCLAFVNALTKDTINQRGKMDSENQRRQVMSEAESFKEIKEWKEKDQSGIIREAYAAYNGQKLIGYVFTAFSKGYGGEITVTVGVGTDKKISGVRIGENKETPGLGTKTVEDSFINQYIGKNTQNKLKIVKRIPFEDNEIQAISGATISSKAVTSAVQASAELGAKLLQNGGKRE